MDYEIYATFEKVCSSFLSADDLAIQRLQNELSSEEFQTLQIGAGCYRLLTDESYYNAVRDALCERIMDDAMCD